MQELTITGKYTEAVCRLTDNKETAIDPYAVAQLQRLCDNETLSGCRLRIMPDDMEIRWELFHCGGHGGQNVNKVETGVRLVHIPTGITVTSTEQRSQYQNKAVAMQKLNAILADMGESAKAKQVNDAWKEHTRIVRGNPVRVYEGEKFLRKDQNSG